MSEQTDNGKRTIALEVSIEQLVNQVALQLMGYVYEEEGDVDFDGDDASPPRSRRATVRDMVMRIVAERTRRAVDEAIKTVTTPMIEAAVAQALADGWQKTDSYGSPEGPRKDLKGRISDILLERGGPYASDRRPLVERIVGEHVVNALNKELKPLVDQAKKQLQSELDAGVAAKFAEVVKTALGVSRG